MKKAEEEIAKKDTVYSWRSKKGEKPFLNVVLSSLLLKEQSGFFK